LKRGANKTTAHTLNDNDACIDLCRALQRPHNYASGSCKVWLCKCPFAYCSDRYSDPCTGYARLTPDWRRQTSPDKPRALSSIEEQTRSSSFSLSPFSCQLIWRIDTQLRCLVDVAVPSASGELWRRGTRILPLTNILKGGR